MATRRVWYSETALQNADSSTASKAAGSILHAMKTLLTGENYGANTGASGHIPAASKWNVLCSSNSSTAGAGDNTGGATYDNTKWVRNTAGNARTWVCLESPDADLYFVMEYVGSNDNNVKFYISFTAPSDNGSTTALPTFTELLVANPSPYGINDLTATAWYVSVAVDEDGGFCVAWRKSTDSWATVFQAVYKLDDLTDESDAYPWVAVGEFAVATPGCPGDGYATYSGITVAAKSADGTIVGDATNGLVRLGFMAVDSTHLLSGKVFAVNAAGETTGFKIPVIVFEDAGGSSSPVKEVKGYLPDCFQVGKPELFGTASPASGSREYTLCGAWKVPFGGAI